MNIYLFSILLLYMIYAFYYRFFFSFISLFSSGDTSCLIAYSSVSIPHGYNVSAEGEKTTGYFTLG